MAKKSKKKSPKSPKKAKILEEIWEPKQIIREACEGGADWGAKRVVLLRVEYASGHHAEVWWWRGHTYWSGVGCKAYAPAELCVALTPIWRPEQRTVGGANTHNLTIHAGGRLSAGLLTMYEDKIDTILRVEGATKLIQIKKTLRLKVDKEWEHVK